MDDLKCESCGAAVFWGLPRGKDPCAECKLPIDGSEGKYQPPDDRTKLAEAIFGLIVSGNTHSSSHLWLLENHARKIADAILDGALTEHGVMCVEPVQDDLDPHGPPVYVTKRPEGDNDETS